VAQNYAMLLIEMEEWEKAARMLDSIRRYAPDLAPAYFRFAQALAHTDHTNEAVQALTQGAALMDPRKALGWMARPDFDALRDNPDFRVLINELSAAEK
jgi:predicted Zn-dependent protease